MTTTVVTYQSCRTRTGETTLCHKHAETESDLGQVLRDAHNGNCDVCSDVCEWRGGCNTYPTVATMSTDDCNDYSRRICAWHARFLLEWHEERSFLGPPT